MLFWYSGVRAIFRFDGIILYLHISMNFPWLISFYWSTVPLCFKFYQISVVWMGVLCLFLIILYTSLQPLKMLLQKLHTEIIHNSFKISGKISTVWLLFITLISSLKIYLHIEMNMNYFWGLKGENSYIRKQLKIAVYKNMAKIRMNQPCVKRNLLHKVQLKNKKHNQKIPSKTNPRISHYEILKF